MNDMSLDVADLRRLCTVLLDAVERDHGPQVDLSSVDYYWVMGLREAYEMCDDPASEITAGQVSDDVVELRQILGRACGEGVFLWHDMAHLCGVLRAIAYLDLP
ncbi:hypothetical protein ABGB17_29340 [Sphaerisporangium sp. B11E5]|uniref:hypothetical protein n=1 Tax=Sphaerisporangium sp. B11E5 TaxID=3153563 RepID=UPI00325DA90F